MQPEKVILLPPTHEVSTPSFHVEGSLAAPFLKFLKSKGIETWQPVEELEKAGPDHRRVVEMRIEADTPTQFLESLVAEFLSQADAKKKPPLHR